MYNILSHIAIFIVFYHFFCIAVIIVYTHIYTYILFFLFYTNIFFIYVEDPNYI